MPNSSLDGATLTQVRPTLGRPHLAAHHAVEVPRSTLIAKRIFDLAGSAVLLLLAMPAMLLIAAIVRLDGGTSFYGHPRIGQGGREFRCLKFRSMVVGAEHVLQAHLAANPAAAAEWATRHKLRNDPRITWFGALLRKTSLDELPQLWNVLRGDMSLVGPRPVTETELADHYGPTGAAAYQEMRPGITGLWQISGRSDTSYRERVALDMRYVRGCSLVTDLRILALTVPAVLARRGAA